MDRGFVDVHVVSQCCIGGGDDWVAAMLNKSGIQKI